MVIGIERLNKDLVIGLCMHYSISDIEPFVASLQKSAPNAELVLFISNSKGNFPSDAAKLGIVTQDARPYLNLGHHPLNARFFMYRDFLARNNSIYRRVLVTDVRDVIFQSDPFEFDFKYGAYFSLEDQLISDDAKWNSAWLNDLYGENLLKEIHNNPVSCAGTTIGTYDGIVNYVNLMCSELDRSGFDKRVNYDQGVHNYIVWKLRPEWACIDFENFFVKTVIKTNIKTISIQENGIWVQGKKPPIVHQWDRQPAMVEFVGMSAYFKLLGPDGRVSSEVASSNSFEKREFNEIREVAILYRNDPEVLGYLHHKFTDSMTKNPILLRLREYVEVHELGFGDRAFYWAWKLLVDAMPSSFSFLEIGVYKGQTLSLVGMLAANLGKQAKIYGVTPLKNVGDKYSSYAPDGYAESIENLQQWAGVPLGSRALIIDGLSNEDHTKSRCRAAAPFDIIYIDGGHDYHIVANDIISYSEMIRHNGYLVMDDSSSDLNLPEGIWRGHPDVGRAVKDILIPMLTDQNLCAQSRNPMDMMRHGWASSFFQASQQ